MSRLNDEKFKQMQDEMSRFEEEIGLPNKGGVIEKQKIIGTNTYSDAQKHLAASQPPPLFVPHQVRGVPQRPGGNPQLNNPSLGAQIPFANPPFPGVLPSPEKPQAAVLSATPLLYVANQAQAESSTQPIENPIIIHTEYDDPHVKKTHKKEKKSDKNGDDLKKNKKFRKCIRTAGGSNWEDPTLADWEEDDFRLFCGDLGNDVTDEVLTRAFSKYPSFLRAKVVRDKRTNKTKGFGFVSFKDPQDFIRATKEMNGRYVGSRPIKLRKSTWRNRSMDIVRKKEKEKVALLQLLLQK